MRWLNSVGVAMQVVGLAVAMVLLARLREAITGSEVVLLRWFRSVRRALGRWFDRVFRRKPRVVFAYAGLADGLGLSDSAHAVVTRGPMPEGLSTEGQIAWLTEFVRDVERRHNGLSTEVNNERQVRDAAMARAREDTVEMMRTAVDEARDDFKRLVGQDLGWEVLSLGLIAVGVVLAAL